MTLKIDRQYLEDLSNNFLPFMLKVSDSRARLYEGTDSGLLEKICHSILKDIDVMLQRKKLTIQKRFTIKLKDAEGIILMKALMSFPVPAELVWRWNLRNQIVEQLNNQIL